MSFRGGQLRGAPSSNKFVNNEFVGANGKFIGGAERARREAQKRRAEHGVHPQNGGGRKRRKSKSNRGNVGGDGTKYLPKSMKPSERFFASLLQSSTSDIEASNDSDELRTKVMSEACCRLGLPLPAQLTATNADAHQFYSSRASLVLEESRFILSEALMKRRRTQRQSRQPHRSYGQHNILNHSIRVQLVSLQERKKTGTIILTFEKVPYSQSRSGGKVETSFSPSEMYAMRPGCCFKIRQRETIDAMNPASFLGAVYPQFKYDREGGCNSLSLMVFRRGDLPEKPEGVWEVIALTTLISQSRQFEACTRKVKVSFLPKLLAWKDATHTRFNDSDDISSQNNETKDVDNEEDPPSASFVLPKLNATQERAAETFLKSPSSTLSLVQGPPGSGKTTFLVSVICKCLFSPVRGRGDGQRRILVTAPTNKAITVLASRFLDALNGDGSLNVIMIGVEDKLVSHMGGDESSPDMDDPFIVASLPSPLRAIYVYTWIQSMQDQFRYLQRSLQPQVVLESKIDSIEHKAKQLRRKLVNGIPHISKMSGATDVINKFVNLLRRVESTLMPSSSEMPSSQNVESGVWEEARHCVDLLLSTLESIDKAAATEELLATADVIFCTLSTAGVSVMKQTKRIDDLFVDEAAAATEPEICIPFHLNPDRMLAVGDPLQLPAMVMSKHAMKMGLNKSLHERLMFDCAKEHIMLDVQYRMRPEISSFPSRHFYGGKLFNGDNVESLKYNSHVNVFDGNPYVFLEVEGTEKQYANGSYSNTEEALAVVEIVKMLRFSASKQTEVQSWDSPDKIRIITFYQGQVSLIRQMLHQNRLGQILVATVDSSQGCEADVVIVSFVRSNENYGSVRHTAGFLTDNRRMNVALTRAKFQLLCVGNTSFLAKSGAETLKAIVDDAKAKQSVSCFGPMSDEPAKNMEQRKEELLRKQVILHKKIIACSRTVPLEKKRSMLKIASLQKEIIEIKKQRLHAAQTAMAREKADNDETSTG